MKKLILGTIILTSCSTTVKDKNNLENSIWKNCGNDYTVGDILVFSKDNLYIKNDSIFFHKSKSLIGVLDKIEYYYGERRLYVKDLKGNVARYCEQ